MGVLACLEIAPSLGTFPAAFPLRPDRPAYFKQAASLPKKPLPEGNHACFP